MLQLKDVLNEFADGTILQRQTRLAQLQGTKCEINGWIGEVSGEEIHLIPRSWILSLGREHVVNISYGKRMSSELVDFARNDRAHLTLSLNRIFLRI